MGVLYCVLDHQVIDFGLFPGPAVPAFSNATQNCIRRCELEDLRVYQSIVENNISAFDRMFCCECDQFRMSWTRTDEIYLSLHATTASRLRRWMGRRV